MPRVQCRNPFTPFVPRKRLLSYNLQGRVLELKTRAYADIHDNRVPYGVT